MKEESIAIFLSSTFMDFKEERNCVTKAILIAGMHPIRAEDMGCVMGPLDKCLKNLIDKSDGVLFLIGDRYGSESSNAISWTQEECEYAIKSDKRLFLYIRETNEDMIEFIDRDKNKERKLEQFKRSFSGRFGNVPTYKHGDLCRLAALITKNLLDYQEELLKIRYDNGFTD